MREEKKRLRAENSLLNRPFSGQNGQKRAMSNSRFFLIFVAISLRRKWCRRGQKKSRINKNLENTGRKIGGTIGKKKASLPANLFKNQNAKNARFKKFHKKIHSRHPHVSGEQTPNKKKLNSKPVAGKTKTYHG